MLVWNLFSCGWPIWGLTRWFENVGLIWMDLWRSQLVILIAQFWFFSWYVSFLFLDCRLLGVSLVFGGNDVMPLPFDFYKSSWWMPPCWSFAVMNHDWDHEWSTPLKLLDLCFYISCFVYALTDWWVYDVIYGSLRFVPVVTMINVVSWGSSMITLRFV